MSKVLEAVPQRTQSATITLASALAEIEKKRVADVIRFRSCCADPRASK